MEEASSRTGITRRAILLGLGGSVLGTTAFGTGTAGLLSDREIFPAAMQGAELDLAVGWEGSITLDGETIALGNESDTDGNDSDSILSDGDPCESLLDPDGLPEPLFELEGIRPGDRGEATFAAHVCGNDGYVWLDGSLVANEENDLRSDEEGDDTPDEGELADRVQARVWYDSDCSGDPDGDEIEIASGSLATVLATLESGHSLSPHPRERACMALGTIEDEQLQAAGDIIEMPMGEERVLLEVRDIEFKTDSGTETETDGSESSSDGSEVTAVELSVLEPEEFGICEVGVKAGPDIETWSYEDCSQSVFVDSIEKTGSDSEPGDYYGISQLTVSVCRDTPRCFEASTPHCIGFEWWLPEDAPTDAQTDSVVFDLGFHAVQCRPDQRGVRP